MNDMTREKIEHDALMDMVLHAEQHQGVFGSDEITPMDQAMMLIDGFNAASGSPIKGWWHALRSNGYDPERVYLVVAIEGMNRSGGFDSSGMLADCFNAVVAEFVSAWIANRVLGVQQWADSYLNGFAARWSEVN